MHYVRHNITTSYLYSIFILGQDELDKEDPAIKNINDNY